MIKQQNFDLLEPLFNVIQHVHWDGGNHHDLLRVIFENKDHVEILQAELDTLKVDQLDVFQSDGKRRLEKNSKLILRTGAFIAERREFPVTFDTDQ